jgi:hypothetical protein
MTILLGRFINIYMFLPQDAVPYPSDEIPELDTLN